MPNKEAHFATYPPKLVSTCILAGCPEGGIVLDPFMESGSVGVACVNTCRNFIGIELDGGYFEIAKSRISEAETIHNQQKII